MFDHVTLRVADLAVSHAFYAAVLGAAGFADATGGDPFWEWEDFSIAAATADRPPTAGLHVGFAVASRADVDAFWQAGIAAGAEDDGAPGPRPDYTPSYYGGFLRDPDGNSAEAVHREGRRQDGHVDHVWIRVADAAASKAFYAAIAPHAGLRLQDDAAPLPCFLRTGPGGGSFTLVESATPTAEVHMAFPGPDHATVHAFHSAAVAAGARDVGGPGERPVYHDGYYAAFVLDPDGNVIEVVDHGR